MSAGAVLDCVCSRHHSFWSLGWFSPTPRDFLRVCADQYSSGPLHISGALSQCSGLLGVSSNRLVPHPLCSVSSAGGSHQARLRQPLPAAWPGTCQGRSWSDLCRPFIPVLRPLMSSLLETAVSYFVLFFHHFRWEGKSGPHHAVMAGSPAATF